MALPDKPDKSKRIIVTASFHHESNTFNPIITDESDFNIHYGDTIYSVLEDYMSVWGILDTFKSFEGYELIPTIFARAVPNGEVSRELYETLKEEMLKRMNQIERADAVTLALHGSMRVEGLGEAEGDLLEAIRAIFPNIPLVAALDMHATISEKMLSYADAFCGYKQAPHTDCFETGALAARITRETLESGRPLTMSCRKIPMLIAGEKSETSTQPMKSLIEELHETEKEERILAASFLLGFPWADCADNGVCSLVVSLDDQQKADFHAEKLAGQFWSEKNRFQFHTETYTCTEALELALNADESPVYLSDSGDNPTAGSSADCTGFLEMILQSPDVLKLESPLLYAGIYDPAAVDMALTAENGQIITLSFGAGFDKRTSKPLTRSGRIVARSINWGSYESNLVLFGTGNTEIILVNKHIGFLGPDMFEALGVDVRSRKVVCVKLGYLTAAHKAVAARSIMALSEGSSNEVLESLSYEKVKRPIFPLDFSS